MTPRNAFILVSIALFFCMCGFSTSSATPSRATPPPTNTPHGVTQTFAPAACPAPVVYEYRQGSRTVTVTIEVTC